MPPFNLSLSPARCKFWKSSSTARLSLHSKCARCGIGAETCHYYVADPGLEHVPAYRAEQLRKVYRREHDFFGKFFPNWVNAKDLDEAANYGVFLGDTARAKQIAQRIIDEAKRLEVQEVIIAECGHACAALVWDAPNWFGETFPFRIRSIVELIAEYVEQGRLQLDPSANCEPITYHDSCNLARTSGIYREPRVILNAAAQDFREMTPHGLENYCCGGGGGLVALPEYEAKRMRAGKPKAEQIRQTGAQTVIAACENCRLQLGDLNNYYGLNVQVSSLVALVVKAMRLPKAEAAAIPSAITVAVGE